MKTLKYIDRTSNVIQEEKIPGKAILKWLYHSGSGKLALNTLFKRKMFSEFSGWYLDTRFSAKRINKFVKKYDINLNEFEHPEAKEYKTFNKFFYRKLRSNKRNIGQGVVSPADGKILTYQSISNHLHFCIKGSEFNLQRFIQDEELVEMFKDGSMAIIRLGPADYHRFHFPVSGRISSTSKIKGKYYSVSPLALKDSLRIFCENKREYSLISTEKYGKVLMVEVGATMVGSIIQTFKSFSDVKKGAEKGYFSFGGSTIVLLFEKDKVVFADDLIENTNKGLETSINMGENIASEAHQV
ncbi:MAG: phosphatidylserine decarboxylase [Carboxylicivirga sp.]|jgi:phosphatidylserine decarboxylase|nr:phosphatidylserine decarboxylase [Carboxylicivirga sp.]